MQFIGDVETRIKTDSTKSKLVEGSIHEKVRGVAAETDGVSNYLRNGYSQGQGHGHGG